MVCLPLKVTQQAETETVHHQHIHDYATITIYNTIRGQICQKCHIAYIHAYIFFSETIATPNNFRMINLKPPYVTQ